MKDKIKQWVLQCKKMYSVKDRVELIHDCIQALGLSNEWVSGITGESVEIGNSYLWYRPSGNVSFCKALDDGLLTDPNTVDEDFWPYSKKLVGRLYGPIPPSEAKS